MQTQKQNYVGYVRVSTLKQVNSGLSLENQQLEITNYINSIGGNLITILIENDKNLSGGNSERETLKKAVELCKKHKANLVVTKIDRLARGMKHFIELCELFEKMKLELICLQCGKSKIERYSLALFAEIEKDFINARVEKTMQTRKQRNLDKGLVSNYGFGNPKNFQTEKAKIGRVLGLQNINRNAKERNHAAIKFIELYLKSETKNYTLIAKKLTEVGIKTAKGCNYIACTVMRLIDKYIQYKPSEYITISAYELMPKDKTLKQFLTENSYENLGKYVFDMISKGYKLSTVASQLNSHSIQTKQNSLFYSQTIKRIYDNYVNNKASELVINKELVSREYSQLNTQSNENPKSKKRKLPNS